MSVPQQVLTLVETFARNRETYTSSSYNETQLRREFLDPLFAALGWDVNNTSGYAEAYKDVIHEDSIKIGSATKAPDYCFRIGGTRKFFLEAKKPAIDIKHDIHPAFQLRRYAWSAKLGLSILTDFEEFAVYDGRVRPVKTDKAATARVKYIKYNEYPDRWDEIADIFSRDAILKGSFDKYAVSTRRKKGTAEVDAAFLAEIEMWRNSLARNIALRNPGLTNRELNFAVQRTVDRILFLRMCEDRGIEIYGQLLGLTNGAEVYKRLCAVFRRADEKYNSGLFYFEQEKGRSEGPDELTPGLMIDDKVLSPILKRLYYPDSPYEFSVLPAEILGNVYEQFLGKVITLTAGHRAKVEDKPEVKKAGGVYYTPTYIVEYIVKNTVGKLLEGKTPNTAAKLKILDPACGSGSFLIGAYQYLLDWHLRYYTENGPEQWAKKKNPRVYQSKIDEWKLTTGERKRILLNNIYGVDIDTQAVEVTKLSLLLKVLEGENQASLDNQLRLFHERALPDLSDNIKCGNSLIGPDFYEHRQMNLFDDEEMYRINAFDWGAEFPGVFKKTKKATEGTEDTEYGGGFDAVIGNPPYIRIQTMKDTQPESVEYFRRYYKSAAKGNYDIYVVFVEMALSLLNNNGRTGYILPHKFFNAKYGKPLREILSKGKHLSHVVHFGHQQVFTGATTYTCLLFLNKSSIKECHVMKVNDLNKWHTLGKASEGFVCSKDITLEQWNFIVGKDSIVFKKLSTMPLRLGKLASRIFQGFKTGADPVFILEVYDENKYFSKALDAEVELEQKYLRPLYKSGQMKRYTLNKNMYTVIFPYKNGRLVPWDELTSTAPKIAHYLDNCRKLLAKRERGRFDGPNWYGYSRNQALEIMSSSKILTADLNPFASYCIDLKGKACFPGGAAGGYGIVVPDNLIYFILGLLNSKTIDFYLKHISTNYRGGWFGYDAKVLRQLPICNIDFSKTKDNSHHNNMVKLVETMLGLHKKLVEAKVPDEKKRIERQISVTDRQIDGLVYELYGLTPDEISIVEGEN